MYAIIQTGGKQYRVQPGDRLKVEKLVGEPGTEVSFDRVLALTTGDELNLGTPFVDGASVSATIVKTARDRKIVVFKKKRRQGYHKKQGHRQWYTLLQINGLSTSQARAAEPPIEAEAAPVAPETTENS
jgi:large subunit ribosomal protein L21